MAKRSWTEAQQAAINTRDRTLLVSAAAGSGKTATLTERIVQSILDPHEKGDISRMLIVTFTRSAAAELRTRIGDALNAAIAVEGRTPHLVRQSLLLPGAHISTIDSFCIDLVRANAVRLGLSPSFRIADGAENLLLMHSTLNSVIEDAYDGKADFCTGEEFCALVDCLGGARGDKELADLLLSLYDKTQAYIRSTGAVGDVAEKMREVAELPPFETPWGASLAARAARTLDSFIGRYERTIPLLAADADAAIKYLPAFETELSDMRLLRDALTRGYTAAREACLGFSKASLKGLREKTEDSEAAKRLKAEFGAFRKKLLTGTFAYAEEEWKETLATLAARIRVLGRILEAFSTRVWEEKRRRGVCNFNDIAHSALRLLCDEKGVPTPLAMELGEDFDAVYVDEYQDVNEVQHAIFAAIAKPHGRFMVGDIKQSIYGFRGAQPEIFAAIRREFPPLKAGEDQQNASLSLSKNFRSYSTILHFANLIFGRLMQGVGEHIGYSEAEDALVPGRPTPDDPPRITVALFEQKKNAKAEEETNCLQSDGEAEKENTDGDVSLSEEASEEEISEEIDAEARYVARRIKEELASRKRLGDREIRPGDIAVLVRYKASGERFARALAAEGIRAETASKKGFFVNAEILLALALLNTIDNPHRDVYLAGVLRSPLYGFTADELVSIRRAADASEEHKGCTLYEALCLYVVSTPDFEKGKRFLREHASFRHMAEGQPVDRLIWNLYRETGLLSIAGADKDGSPAARRANLMLLYDYARRFEASSYRGLYNFVAYINEAIERGQSIDEGTPQSARTDTVRIMTVHQSKGLEYPICFLSDCGREGARGVRGIPFHNHLGCALQLRDPSGFGRIRNPVYDAIAAAIAEAETEEEMRVLYVALTRPRDALYVTATVKDVEATLATAKERGRAMGAEEAYACKTVAEMILAAGAGDDSYDLVFPEEQETPATLVRESGEETDGVDAETVADIEALLKDRFSYAYPYRHLTTLPSKMSVSRLHPTALNEEEPPSVPALDLSAEPTVSDDIALPALAVRAGAEGLSLVDPERDGEPSRKAPVPHFMGGRAQDAAARAGTATHLFMQFCDFARLARTDAMTELARLVEDRFLSAEDAALVRPEEIRAFEDSAFLSALLAGGRLYREMRFHVRLPAAAFTDDPVKKAAYANETVLVQGVMDGVLVREDGEIWLFDYKTDRLTDYEKTHRAAAEEKLCGRHRLQLSYYAEACRAIFGRTPDRVLIYSLPLGDTVEVDVAPVI